MRRPASLFMQTDAREAPGNTALPPLRAGRANAPMRDRRAPLMCNVPRFRPGGLGANKPPRWSAERRASPGARTAKAGLRGDARRALRACGPTSLARRRVPLHPAPVGAPPPHWGGFGKLGGVMPREKEDVCSLSCPGQAEAKAGAKTRDPGLWPRKASWVPALRCTASASLHAAPRPGHERAAPYATLPAPSRYPQDGTFPFTLYPWCNSAGRPQFR